MTDTTDTTDTTGAPFTDGDRRAIQAELSRMPYGGMLHPHSHMVTNGPTLVAWLVALRGRLDDVAQEHRRTEEKLATANGIIAAGRTLFAAFAPVPAEQPDPRPDCGDRASLVEALGHAIADAGERGASLVEIEHWIINNRSGGPVPRSVIAHYLAELQSVGHLVVTKGPTWTRWSAPVYAVTALVAAIAAHGEAGATAEEIAEWVSWGRPIRVSVEAVTELAERQHEAGNLLTSTDCDTVRRYTLVPIDQCDECETTGKNCLLHRTDAVGAAARS
jgi:hypothetical protein